MGGDPSKREVERVDSEKGQERTSIKLAAAGMPSCRGLSERQWRGCLRTVSLKEAGHLPLSSQPPCLKVAPGGISSPAFPCCPVLGQTKLL